MQNLFRHVTENHGFTTFETMNKNGTGFQQQCSWFISKLKFHRSISQMNQIELLRKIKVLLSN